MTNCCAGAADVNLLKVPEGMEDNKVVLLSDVMPTGWHGATLANVQKGNRVAVWGCGPGAPGLPNSSMCPCLNRPALSHIVTTAAWGCTCAGHTPRRGIVFRQICAS